MVKELSQKDLVKLGLHEQGRGKSLDEIEADYRKHGVDRSDYMKALKTIDYLKKKEDRKAQGTALHQQNGSHSGPQQPIQTKGSSFWFWLILLILIGTGLYFYFSGTFNFASLYNKFFK